MSGIVPTFYRQSLKVCACAAVRSRSLLFFDEGSPLEESLAPSEGERLQAPGHSHIQMSRYTADAHSNRSAGTKADSRSEAEEIKKTALPRSHRRHPNPPLVSSPQRTNGRRSLRGLLTAKVLLGTHLRRLHQSFIIVVPATPPPQLHHLYGLGFKRSNSLEVTILHLPMQVNALKSRI